MKTPVLDCRNIRLESNLNQHDFWQRLGVTQSGGSRYENGRNMPKPVRQLLNLVYVLKLDLDKVDAESVLMAQYLNEVRPAEFSQIKADARAWAKAKAKGSA